MTDGFVDPERARFDQFKALDRDEPCDMLNLVRLHRVADYPTDHPLSSHALSGAEAYSRYGAQSAPVLARVGGSILWRGDWRSMLIGPETEHWDHIFVARYPSAHAFLAMVKDPDYAPAVVHRQAAVATSRLIRCAPAQSGESFG